MRVSCCLTLLLVWTDALDLSTCDQITWCACECQVLTWLLTYIGKRLQLCAWHCIPMKKCKTSHPLTSLFSQTNCWLSGCTGSPAGLGVPAWTLKEKPICWLLWPLALKWSVFIWLSSAINSSVPFTRTIENCKSRAGREADIGRNIGHWH